MKNKFIPVCEPLLGGKEIEYVTDAVRSTWISSKGKYLDKFEKGFAEYVGLKYAISTPNGTTALHLGLKALGIGEGDEVILPTFTMIASAFSVCYCGAMPVFVDCTRDTWNIDVKKVEEKVTSKTKAILVVHIYGHPCDMDPIIEIAKKHNLLIIEDAAEVHGAEYKGRKCGELGDVSCFSFFANKIITCGEGGMVLTNDEEVYKKASCLKNLAFPLGLGRVYSHDAIGFNYRMSNVHAAIGLAQLEKIDEYIEKRRNNARSYSEKLVEIEGISLPVEKEWAKNVYWMYSIIIEDEFGISRDNLIEKLRIKNIDSRTFFIPMHRQEALIEYGCNCEGDYPVSEEISEKGLYLPSSTSLTESKIDYICNNIREIQKFA